MINPRRKSELSRKKQKTMTLVYIYKGIEIKIWKKLNIKRSKELLEEKRNILICQNDNNKLRNKTQTREQLP